MADTRGEGVHMFLVVPVCVWCVCGANSINVMKIPCDEGETQERKPGRTLHIKHALENALERFIKSRLH